MLVIAKSVLLALAIVGVAATGVAAGAIDLPLQNAIDVHKDHLGQNSTMPEQSTHGQQNALDHLMENQQRWMSKPHNETDDDDLNDTDDDLDDIDDDEQNETDDEDLDEDDEEELNEINDNVFGNAVVSVLNWIKTAF